MQVGKYITVGQGNLLRTSCSSTLKMEVAKSWYSILEEHNLCSPVLLLRWSYQVQFLLNSWHSFIARIILQIYSDWLWGRTALERCKKQDWTWNMTRMERCNELHWAWHRTGTKKCKMAETGSYVVLEWRDIKSQTVCGRGPEQRAVKSQSVCSKTGMERCK